VNVVPDPEGLGLDAIVEFARSLALMDPDVAKVGTECRFHLASHRLVHGSA
jgi:hypothetical protein